MAQLLQIANYQIVAVSDDVEITPEMRRDALTKSRHDLRSIIDRDVTSKIEKYLIRLDIDSKPFESHVANPYPETTTDDKYTYIYPQYSLDSHNIPELIKMAGLQISRAKKIVYFTDDPENPDAYKLVDDSGKDFDTDTRTSAWHRPGEIQINDIIAAIPNHDYKEMSIIRKGVTHDTYNQYPRKLIRGSVLVDEILDDEHKCIDTIEHELKHAKNSVLRRYKLITQRNTKLSALDMYKLEVDNEISARIAEVLNGIEVVQRRNKTMHLTLKEMMTLNMAVYEYIMPNSNRIDMARTFDIETIVKLTFDHYKKVYMDAYREQYKKLVRHWLFDYPPDLIADQPNDAAYKEMRSQYYNFSVYNPVTGNYINMDLSKFVPEIEVPDEDLAQIQDEQQKAIATRTTSDRHLPEVAVAIAMQRTALKQSPFGRRIAQLQEMGLNVGAALDWRPNINIVSNEKEQLGKIPIKDPVVNVAPIDTPNNEPGKKDLLAHAIAKTKRRTNQIVMALFAKNKQEENA